MRVDRTYLEEQDEPFPGHVQRLWRYTFTPEDGGSGLKAVRDRDSPDEAFFTSRTESLLLDIPDGDPLFGEAVEHLARQEGVRRVNVTLLRTGAGQVLPLPVLDLSGAPPDRSLFRHCGPPWRRPYVPGHPGLRLPRFQRKWWPAAALLAGTGLVLLAGAQTLWPLRFLSYGCALLAALMAAVPLEEAWRLRRRERAFNRRWLPEDGKSGVRHQT